MVDAASAAQAEEAISLLRQTLETFPAKPPAPRNPPAGLLTAWLLDGSAPADFVPAEACELRDSEDTGRVIRCKGQDLGSEDIRNLLRAGMQVVKLALDWDERLSFVLADDLSLKSLRVGDALLETVEDADDPVARLDAEFALLALQLRELFTRLDTLFGLAANEVPGRLIQRVAAPSSRLILGQEASVDHKPRQVGQALRDAVVLAGLAPDGPAHPPLSGRVDGVCQGAAGMECVEDVVGTLTAAADRLNLQDLINPDPKLIEVLGFLERHAVNIRIAFDESPVACGSSSNIAQGSSLFETQAEGHATQLLRSFSQAFPVQSSNRSTVLSLRPGNAFSISV